MLMAISRIMINDTRISSKIWLYIYTIPTGKCPQIQKLNGRSAAAYCNVFLIL